MRRKKKELLRAAIYARRTVDDKKSDSIQMQIETCQRHLEISRRDRIESVSLYIDEGFSRRNTNRPDWQRMMQDIEDGQLDLICVYRIDRISGNMLDFSMFHTKVVDDYGLELIAVREGIDSAYSITGNTMAYISATMATHEVKQDSIRSFDNSRNLAVHGFWSGGKPPLGYTLIPVTVNGKIHKMLELLPEDIEYKKNLVSLFLDNNFTLSSMEGYLKRNSIKTRNGKFFQPSSSIPFLLRHSVSKTLQRCMIILLLSGARWNKRTPPEISGTASTVLLSSAEPPSKKAGTKTLRLTNGLCASVSTNPL